MSYVMNEAVASCCGQPTRNCSCDMTKRSHRAGDNDRLPAGGSLAQNSAIWGFDASQRRAEVRGSSSLPSHGGMVTNDRLPAGGSLADCTAAINGR